MSGRHIAGAGLLAAVLFACSPAVRLRTVVVLPAKLLTATYPPGGPASLLNVTISTASSRALVGLPAPAAGPPAGAAYEVEESKDGLVVQLTLHGRRHYVQIVAWFDANRDGRVSSGDAVGHLPAPVLAEDRGIFRGNLTATPPIVATVVP